MEPSQVEPIRKAVRVILDCYSIQPSQLQSNENHVDFCAPLLEEAARRGYTKEALEKPLQAGALIATTAFSHITDEKTRVFIGLLSGITIYVDNAYEHDVSGIRSFTANMLHGKPVDGSGSGLQLFADLIREVACYFAEGAASGMIQTSALDFVASTILEYDIREDASSAEASTDFAQHLRTMTSMSRGFAIMGFGPDTPLSSYIQALTDVQLVTQNTNDVLSFYKEELEEDSVNMVSLRATQAGSTKLEELDKIVSETVKAHRRVLAVLSLKSTLLVNSYLAYIRGWVLFHLMLDTRYKLSQVDLWGSA